MLPPPGLISDVGWRRCPTCGSFYLKDRDTRCRSCLSPLPRSGLILNSGGGKLPLEVLVYPRVVSDSTASRRKRRGGL